MKPGHAVQRTLALDFSPRVEPVERPVSLTPVADRRRAKDRARREARAAARKAIAEAYLFECANRDRLRLCQITIEEFQQTRDWLGF